MIPDTSLLLSKDEWIKFFTKTPCVKSSYLWGIACGALMFAHKTHIYRGIAYRIYTLGPSFS